MGGSNVRKWTQTLRRHLVLIRGEVLVEEGMVSKLNSELPFCVSLPLARHELVERDVK